MVYYGAGPASLADTATVYVTTDGADTRDGTTWETAVATYAKAVSLLPVKNGVTVGIIQFGAGTFTVASGASPAINITATQYITLQGLALTQAYTSGVTPVYLTAISDTGTGDTVHMAGTNAEAQYQQIKNIAFTTTTAANAFVGTNIGTQSLVNVTADGYSVTGYTFNNDIGGPLTGVIATRCGSSGSSSVTGGFYFKTTPNYAVEMNGCAAVGCAGFGVYAAGGQSMQMYDCVFQGTVSSAATGSGAGFYVGGSGNGLGPYTFYSGWFEGNQTYGFDTNQTLPIIEFYGCNFLGVSTQVAGINQTSGGIVLVDGCNFQGNMGESILNPNQFQLTWRGCLAAETNFVNGGSFGNVPRLAANNNGQWGAAGTVSFYAQSLSSNGAVTFFPGIGKHQSMTLTANATSSSIDTANYPAARGAEMTISWIQGAGGSHTYAWPANCKFAGGAAPVASTTAGYEDNVTFRYDGTNWLELSRSVGVH